ncbi:MAG TPA: YqgE/AlgH family protein, partial [Thioalkalivibrio sp.]|nr:YqgE/AlgH family protein [Thioalkalivibrio sp.]
MAAPTYFTNQFLIAMPALADPNFFRSVTLICEHNADGALGIVINQPTDIRLGELLDHLEIATAREDIAALPVYSGGPVEMERGFVLHQPVGTWEGSLQITDQLALTTSSDILRALAEGRGPEHVLVALGYAGWGPGQLEQEMADNAWLTSPASLDILFETPADQRWRAAARQLGIDLDLL